MLQVPTDTEREATYEDPAITDPRQRARVFVQFDHVRIYGRDYPDRLRAAGFTVEVVDFVATLSPRAVEHGAM